MPRFNRSKTLFRVYRLLCIPLPQGGGGTKSAATTGYVSFSEDMRHALPLIQDVIRQCYQGEDYQGSVEETLTKLEAWHAARTRANWDFAGSGWKQRVSEDGQ